MSLSRRVSRPLTANPNLVEGSSGLIPTVEAVAGPAQIILNEINSGNPTRQFSSISRAASTSIGGAPRGHGTVKKSHADAETCPSRLERQPQLCARRCEQQANRRVRQMRCADSPGFQISIFLSTDMKYFTLATAVLGLGMGLSGAAQALQINIGIPAPVVVAPAPVVVVGWHGDRYYDGHQYWARHEWEERQRHHDEHDRDDHHGRDHCPPGHERKGGC
jgi:hypothetical protein